MQSLVSDETDVERRRTLHTILSQITRISGTLKDLFNFDQASYHRTQSLSRNGIDVALLLENVSKQQRRRIWKVVKILCESGQ